MEWLNMSISRNVVRRSTWTAIVVGSLLIAINHGDAILHGQVTEARLFQMILTVFVPYVVATISSVSTMRSLDVNLDRR